MDFDKKEIELRKESILKNHKKKELEASSLKNDNNTSRSVLDRFKK